MKEYVYQTVIGKHETITNYLKLHKTREGAVQEINNHARLFNLKENTGHKYNAWDDGAGRWQTVKVTHKGEHYAIGIITYEVEE